MIPDGVRRGGRVAKEISILLIGSDTDGKVFGEHTRTVLLSRHGAGIVSQHKLAAEQELIVRRLDTNKEAEVRVVGMIGSESENYTYGLAFLNTQIDFWNVEFPPLTESEKGTRYHVVECSACKNRETVDLSGVTSDVYAIHKALIRYCQHCTLSTIWKQIEGTDAPKSEQAPESPQASAQLPEMPVAPEQNRRARVRATVQFTACIRLRGFEDDTVVCEDISRGGFRFKSRKRYRPGTSIEAAVPYHVGQAHIFVRAQIVYAHELAEQGLFRYGAAYSRPARLAD